MFSVAAAVSNQHQTRVVPVTMWNCVLGVYKPMNVNANLSSMRTH